MFTQLISRWREINWKVLIISLIIQLSIWFYIPIRYAKGVSTATFEFNLWLVGLYAATIAISSFLIFSSNFKSPFAMLSILASFILAFSGVIKGNLTLLLLLLLLPIFLLIVQIGFAQLKNEYGLIIYSLLVTVSVPATIAFMSVHFLSWSFIQTLIPLFFLSSLFLTPVFVEKNNFIFSITNTVSAIIFIILVLTQSISVRSILAILLVVLGWFGMHNFPNMKHQYVTYGFLELLVVLLIY